MYQSISFTLFSLFLSRNLILFMIFSTGLSILLGCNAMSQKYTVEEQYSLASSRIDKMKEQLDFRITLEKEVVHRNDPILFMAHFTNNVGSPLTLRLPEQSGVLDINHANTRLQYSITPLDKTISLLTPIAYLGMPFILSNDVQPSEFVTLEPNQTKDVKLELPNTVYLKQEEIWIESVLPPGQYLIHISYKNLYIGYQIEKKGRIYIIDISAWVGEVDAKPALLTISP